MHKSWNGDKSLEFSYIEGIIESDGGGERALSDKSA